MKEIVTTVTSKGQVTIPAEVRLKPAAFTLESVRGLVAPLPNTSADFEREIAQAMEERAAERTRQRHSG